MKLTKDTVFGFVIIGLLIIIAFLYWAGIDRKPTDPIRNPQDSITILKLNKVLALQSDSIDSLKTSKNKVHEVIKTVTVYVDSLTFAQTIESCIAVFDSVVLVPRETDTIIGFTEKQVKQAIATDTILKLTRIELSKADSIIDIQGNRIDTLQVKVNVIQIQSDRWQNAYNNSSEAYASELRWKKIWRGTAIGSVVLNILMGVVK
jgi:FtsZ-binding cell division protein ZapB